jgi:hypothetical protein
MKSFSAYIFEANNSANLSYKGLGQQAVSNPTTQTGTNFSTNKTVKSTSPGYDAIDVNEWDEEEEENKPWQIREADRASKRHGELLKWLSAVDPEHTSQIPELPDWQIFKKNRKSK